MAIWPPQMASEAISGHLIYNFFLAWERGEGVEAGACVLLPPLGYLLHTLILGPGTEKKSSISPQCSREGCSII